MTPGLGIASAVLDQSRRHAVTGVAASAPAVQDFGIPLASVLIAVGVIVLRDYALWADDRATRPDPSHTPATAARTQPRPRAPDSQPRPAQPTPPSTSAHDVHGGPGGSHGSTRRPGHPCPLQPLQLAEVNGVQGTKIIVLATALIVSVPATEQSTAVTTAGHTPLRLDRSTGGQRRRRRQRGDLGRSRRPRTAPRRPHDAPSFRPEYRALGYMVLTPGTGSVLRASLPDLLIAGVLGAAIGLLQMASRPAHCHHAGAPARRVAFGVSATVLGLARTGLDLGGLPALWPPSSRSSPAHCSPRP